MSMSTVYCIILHNLSEGTFTTYRGTSQKRIREPSEEPRSKL